MTDTKSNDNSKDVDFNEDELQAVEISDQVFESEDKKAAQSKKEARRQAKLLRTPEEKKQAKRKKILIGAISGALLIMILLVVEATRWPILNAIGFRSTLMITVTQEGSEQPVSGAIVQLNETSATTDSFGHVELQNTTLGNQNITINKIGYATSKLKLKNGFGSTKKTAQLTVIGIKLDIDVKNWLSNRPVAGAKVVYKKTDALSDKTGRASIIIPPTDEKKVTLVVSAPGHLTKKVAVDLSVENREVSLVSNQKNYFISKRDGKYDIFSSNLDGSNQQKIIEATGKEDPRLLQFKINRNNQQAILVANRDGIVVNGRFVAGIYKVDLKNATIQKIDEGSDIQLLDWGQDGIAYVKSSPNLKFDDPNFSKILKYTISTNQLTQITQANYFPISLVVQNKLFYMPADSYRTIDNAVLTSVELSTGARQTYLSGRQPNYGVLANYDTLHVQNVDGSIFSVTPSSGIVAPIDHRTASNLSFALSQNGEQVLWSDRRDGKGALLVRTLKDGKERTVVKAGGLTNPVRFVSSDLAVVRVVTSQETADYIVSTTSGKLDKIVDVSNIDSANITGL